MSLRERLLGRQLDVLKTTGRETRRLLDVDVGDLEAADRLLLRAQAWVAGRDRQVGPGAAVVDADLQHVLAGRRGGRDVEGGRLEHPAAGCPLVQPDAAPAERELLVAPGLPVR